jgi:hypothetical protein
MPHEAPEKTADPLGMLGQMTSRGPILSKDLLNLKSTSSANLHQ